METEYVETALWAAALVIVAFVSQTLRAVRAARRAPAGRAGVGNPAVGTRPGHVGRGTPLTPSGENQLAIFAQGCFWGVEERFRKVPGVVATAVGYTGGHVPNPIYEQVCAHGTGHAESVLIEFDPRRVSYQELLDFFWRTHDPTSGDRQGPDRGRHYRSAIFPVDPEQMKAAVASRTEEQQHLVDPITTEVAPAGPFWLAEDPHQQFDERQGRLSCPLPHRARQVMTRRRPSEGLAREPARLVRPAPRPPGSAAR